MDCFLSRQIDNSTDASDEFFRPLYFKVLLMSFLPILLFIGCYSVWALISLKTKDYKNLKSRSISSLVILLFLIHPNLVQMMFKLFKCVDVDSESRLYADFQIQCYRGPHTFWAFSVAVPSLIVWGLGIPFFALLLLSRERNRLDKVEVKQKFGFLFRGYKKDYYFWEIVIMYRKILMVVIAVIVETYGTISQVIILINYNIGLNSVVDNDGIPLLNPKEETILYSCTQ